MDGPIPGENYTSDTKNYPWHRPPEYTDLDSAIEGAFKKLTEEDNAFGLLTMLEQGATVTQVTSMFLISGIGAGKWTPDFSVLMAGPVAHIIYLMAKGYGVKCNLGIDKKPMNFTSSFFNGMKKIKEDKLKKVISGLDVEEVLDTAQGGGFMGMTPSPASTDTQEQMLKGY